MRFSTYLHELKLYNKAASAYKNKMYKQITKLSTWTQVLSDLAIESLSANLITNEAFSVQSYCEVYVKHSQCQCSFNTSGTPKKAPRKQGLGEI